MRTIYESILRPLIFLTPSETAHKIAVQSFKHSWLWSRLAWNFNFDNDRLAVSAGGITSLNPVGLAAGFDKNCEMFESLSFLGFGYLTLGTVTVTPREGNPKPRIWRFANESLINSMGLPNQGADKIRERLLAKQHNRRIVPIALSISGLSLDDFFDCYLKLELCADAIELNISTPNTSGVRIFQDPMTFEQLLDGILSKRRTNKPIWVKIPPYFDEKTRENVLELVNICRRKSVNAVTAINTKPVKEPRASIGTAGVSGKEIFGDMLRIVRDIYTDTDGKISINACGGIQSAKNAWSALLAGATTIQLYTGLIYQGPGLVAHVNRGIYKLLEKSGFKSIHELTGTERS